MIHIQLTAVQNPQGVHVESLLALVSRKRYSNDVTSCVQCTSWVIGVDQYHHAGFSFALETLLQPG